MDFDLDLFVMHTVHIKYNRNTPFGQSPMKYCTVDESKLSEEQAEFHDYYVSRELYKMRSTSKISLAHWLVESSNLDYFSFLEGYFDDVLIIIGRSGIYWHAQRKNLNDGSIRGALVMTYPLSSGIIGFDVVGDILKMIQDY